MEYKKKLETCGENVITSPQCDFVPYKKVYVGPKSLFLKSKAKIQFGIYIIFGPNVLIVTGNHRIDVIGEYILNYS